MNEELWQKSNLHEIKYEALISLHAVLMFGM